MTGDFNVKFEEEIEDQKDQPIFLGKTDLSSAFRVLPLLISCFCWLAFKAKDPETKVF